MTTDQGYRADCSKNFRFVEVSGWIHVDQMVSGQWVYIGRLVPVRIGW